jgi:hypothetical protein
MSVESRRWRDGDGGISTSGSPRTTSRTDHDRAQCAIRKAIVRAAPSPPARQGVEDWPGARGPALLLDTIGMVSGPRNERVGSLRSCPPSGSRIGNASAPLCGCRSPCVAASNWSAPNPLGHIRRAARRSPFELAMAGGHSRCRHDSSCHRRGI